MEKRERASFAASITGIGIVRWIDDLEVARNPPFLGEMRFRKAKREAYNPFISDMQKLCDGFDMSIAAWGKEVPPGRKGDHVPTDNFCFQKFQTQLLHDVEI